MKKLNYILLLGAGLLVGSSYFLWSSLQSKQEVLAEQLSEHKHTGKEQVLRDPLANQADGSASLPRANNHRLANPWESAPTVIGEAGQNDAVRTQGVESLAKMAEPEKEVVSAAELARRQKLQNLGYMVPTDYYTKDLKTLRQLAKAGDAYAMVHLGEKYAFELNGQTSNPEFEQGVDYAKAAKQSFKDALVAGNIRSAGIIAELYFQEQNVTEAYAWHLVSDQLGDDISANWFKRTEMAQQASAQVKQAAQTRANQIMSELKLSKKSG
ncbi:hypothetical protein RF679_01845 [Undibacterium cyanobacteriorum]|uniref:Sel1 repeat family protein n=1 Tax=Undibacterium cyanobacteriorum TaxID=3073561 RepID=A0ABY9RIJ2_9BURK|nr:hypothetical protein [Undibacterium sp. 20NA77.5]WMW81036.1 hypothetical protein RF679_01845 [Undibacterium sp. 20NA77.5]